MMLLKKFINDATKKSSLMMELKKFHSDANKNFFNDGTKMVPQ